MNQDDILHKVLEEHHAIRTLMSELQQRIDREPELPHRAWIADLKEKARSLCEHLKIHFQLEEREDFTAPILETRPTAIPQVEALKKEHGILLDGLSRLIRDLEEAEETEETRDVSISERLQTFLRALGKHEREEDHLIQSVFTEDLSAGD